MTTTTQIHNDIHREGAPMTALAEHAHWLPRLALAGVFAFHGVQKFTVMGIDGFAGMMGLPWLLALLVALAEVATGVGVLVGGAVRGAIGDALTRLSGLAAMPVLLGAIAMVHWGRWSFTAAESHPMGGMEFQVVLLLLAVWFVVRGNEAGAGR